MKEKAFSGARPRAMEKEKEIGKADGPKAVSMQWTTPIQEIGFGPQRKNPGQRIQQSPNQHGKLPISRGPLLSSRLLDYNARTSGKHWQNHHAEEEWSTAWQTMNLIPHFRF